MQANEADLREMRTDILGFINKHNGDWSWYQLDRALVSHRTDPSLMGHMMSILDQLEQSGYICSEGAGAHPRYQITEAGRRLLEEHKAAA